MTWYANLIYTLPNPQIIQAFEKFPDITDSIFLVNNLDGITSEHTKNWLNETPGCKHGLPEQGLLAIAPPVYNKNGYGTFDVLQQSFPLNAEGESVVHWPWQEVAEIGQEKENLLPDLSAFFEQNEINLFNYLYHLNVQTGVPLFYYECEMWGGSIDMEQAIVFNKEPQVYQYSDDEDNEADAEENKTIEKITGEKIDSTPLQQGFKHLKFDLPTWFFALHQYTFDWQRYRLHHKSKP